MVTDDKINGVNNDFYIMYIYRGEGHAPTQNKNQPIVMGQMPPQNESLQGILLIKF